MIRFLGGGNDKIDNILETIRKDYSEVTEAARLAHLMISLSSRDKIVNIGDNMGVIAQQLNLLNQSLTPGMSQQLRTIYDHSLFQVMLHVQDMLSVIIDEPCNPSKESAFNDRERIFLSPKDRWPRHLYKLATPSTRYSNSPKEIRTLIWIAGDLGRRNVSWVSSFCVDLVSYSKRLENFNVVYAFCKRGEGRRYSPTILIKNLVAQLLETHALIAVKNPGQLSRNRFSEIGTETGSDSGSLAWKLLEDILLLIRATPEFQDRAILILIDRLDLCVSEEYFSVLNHLIPQLQKLGLQIPGVQVLVTTARFSLSAIHTLRKGPEWLRAYGK
ncbi:uncharacterized protein F4822DRAFT_87336 [Hypoxylon trugodes]|uniref:uncharacterized protein n=1 Tax=Hypoxylon trugodes TaxID=326681 RepID=UPI0021A1BF10|nr:uncharacterized protein F4822DRAFT_87336 [Hypoxylon trugodes]KAI1382944.1 hypothetical protein F4822DRAFT_87336 [Hypoxylon trugodes]